MSRILVADDVPIFRALFSTALELGGHTVSTVDTAGGVLQALEGEPPDLLLLDATLPDLSTLELLGRIRVREELRPMHVVLTISILDRPILTAVSRLGFHDFFVKAAYQPAALRKMVQCKLDPRVASEDLHQLLRRSITVRPVHLEVWKELGIVPPSDAEEAPSADEILTYDPNALFNAAKP